jgi:hypothetical protein
MVDEETALHHPPPQKGGSLSDGATTGPDGLWSTRSSVNLAHSDQGIGGRRLNVQWYRGGQALVEKGHVLCLPKYCGMAMGMEDLVRTRSSNFSGAIRTVRSHAAPNRMNGKEKQHSRVDLKS